MTRKEEILIKITSSTTGMESERHYAEFRMDTYSISNRKAPFGSFFTGFSPGMTSSGDSEEKNLPQKDESSFLKALRESAGQLKQRSEQIKAAQESKQERNLHDTFFQFRAACIDYLLLLFLGIDPKKLKDAGWISEGADSLLSVSDSSGLSSAFGRGASYSEYHFYAESETASFRTEGTVLTEDGREIQFGLNLFMSRTFVQESSLRIGAEAAQFADPLVIRLKDCPDVISEQTFSFDIDSDGIEDRINRLVSGSGFLALDKNGDGKINNGSELFGAEDGEGFRELAQYDEDGNGWIDENDSVFEKLKIWTKDRDGNDVLIRLKDGDVGAICLQSSATDFSVKDLMTNSTLARMRRSGFYLRESTGQPGLVHQFDLVKKAYA